MNFFPPIRGAAAPLLALNIELVAISLDTKVVAIDVLLGRRDGPCATRSLPGEPTTDYRLLTWVNRLQEDVNNHNDSAEGCDRVEEHIESRETTEDVATAGFTGGNYCKEKAGYSEYGRHKRRHMPLG